MRLYEYEAKEMLRAAGIMVPEGVLLDSKRPADVRSAIQRVGLPAVVKAQVLTGGRMKAGAVRFAESVEEATAAVADLLGREVHASPVERVLIEPRLEFEREYFVGITYDARARRPAALLSAAGGVDVEAAVLAGEENGGCKESHVHKLLVDPWRGLRAHQARELALGAGLRGRRMLEVGRVLEALWSIFSGRDATLVEINPLVLSAEGGWTALDAHIDLDDDALGRQPDLVASFRLDERGTGLRPPTAFERRAIEIDALDHRGVAGRLVEFEGDLALLIGGGGASLTVFDAVRRAGGRPANYCEVGGNPTVRKVAALTELLLSKPGVERIAVIMNVVNNTRADLMARGVTKGALQAGRDPADAVAVFRIPGAWEDESRKVLSHFGVSFCGREVTIDEAAQLAVDAANEGSSP